MTTPLKTISALALVALFSVSSEAHAVTNPHEGEESAQWYVEQFHEIGDKSPLLEQLHTEHMARLQTTMTETQLAVVAEVKKEEAKLTSPKSATDSHRIMVATHRHHD